jgi:hypothetical protein
MGTVGTCSQPIRYFGIHFWLVSWNIASEISVHQPIWATKNESCQPNFSKAPKKMHTNYGNRDN